MTWSGPVARVCQDVQSKMPPGQQALAFAMLPSLSKALRERFVKVEKPDKDLAHTSRRDPASCGTQRVPGTLRAAHSAERLTLGCAGRSRRRAAERVSGRSQSPQGKECRLCGFCELEVAFRLGSDSGSLRSQFAALQNKVSAGRNKRSRADKGRGSVSACLLGTGWSYPSSLVFAVQPWSA